MSAHESLFPREDYKYQSVEALVLAEGHEFTNREPFTPEERGDIMRLLEVMRRPRFKIGECFYNAWMLAEAAEGGLTGDPPFWRLWIPGMQYVEGFAVNTSIPVLHAWVTLHGKVLDLTWAPNSADGERLNTLDARCKRHNRMYAPQKLIDRSEQLRVRDGAEYWGIAVPSSEMRQHLMRAGYHSSIIEGGGNGNEFLRSGLPASWKHLTAPTAI